MKILQNTNDKTILLNSETNFKLDLGWEDSIQEFEHDTLKPIINPAVNFETVRYIHSGYTSSNNIYQTDIWFYFYFVSGLTYGLNYELIVLTSEENIKILRENNTSFFRLEFYKVPDGELPNSGNRKLVFTKHLPISLGEKIYYTPINDYIYVPVFTGSNYKNKENMFLFWFQDDTVLSGTLLSGSTTGDTFYMTAKFYNTIDGTVINFLNKKSNEIIGPVNEEDDVYLRMRIEKNYSYELFRYTGFTSEERVGITNNPIMFYEN